MTTRDLLTLTKFRLSALVIVTTFVGFWLRAPHGFMSVLSRNGSDDITCAFSPSLSVPSCP